MACDVISCIVDAAAANHSCLAVTVPPVSPDPDDTFDAPGVETVTTETLDGTGVFDIYMRAGSNQLQSQYDAGRIKGAEYAGAYMKMMELMMVEANKFVIGIFQAEVAASAMKWNNMSAKYDAQLKAAQAQETMQKINLLCAQIGELSENGIAERTLKAAQKQTQEQQAMLYERQRHGFDDKNTNDAAKTLLDAWAVQAVEEPDDANYAISALSGANSGVIATNLKNSANL